MQVGERTCALMMQESAAYMSALSREDITKHPANEKLWPLVVIRRQEIAADYYARARRYIGVEE